MKFGKIFVIILLSIVVTTLGIGASDTWQGNSGSLLGQLIGSQVSVCPKGMVKIAQATTFSCVDEFEASASIDCTYNTPSSALQTTDNLNNYSKYTTIVENVHYPYTELKRYNGHILAKVSKFVNHLSSLFLKLSICFANE